MNTSPHYWVSLQVRPAGDLCNIACKYCQYGLSRARTYMSDAVLAEMIRKTLEHNEGGGVFCWHGGEPTLAGVEFYRRVVELQQRYASGIGAVVNQIQTNATQISPLLAEFFKKNEFGVGVSLDGPEQIHDVTRVNKGGGNTYAQALAGILRLREHGVEPSVIATISRGSLPYAREIFHHLVELGFTNIHFSVVFESQINTHLAVSNDEWYGFLRVVFAEWCALGNPEISVRELNEVISWLSGAADPCCTSFGTCAHWFVVDYDGAIYPCEVLGRSRCYGNIMHDSFSTILAAPKHREFVTITESRPAKCTTCDFLQVCNNGCTQMRMADGQKNPRGLYAYCEQRLALFREVKSTFESAFRFDERG